MTAEIIILHQRPTVTPPVKPILAHAPEYSLYWKQDGETKCIYTRDPDRILRQMESLCQRGIQAKAYADGWLCGSIGIDGNGDNALSFKPRPQN